MKAITVRNLKVNIGTGGMLTEAVRGADLTLERGEILVLAGESGSGKTIFCKSIAGLLPRGASASADELTVCGRTAIVLQDPLTSLDPTLTIGRQLAEAASIHNPKLTSKELEARAVELLADVGIERAEERAALYPDNFSGGMRQRVVIAMALAGEPDILLADEPTTALDVTVQDEILKLLTGICRSRGMSLLFVTHDLSVAEMIADRVAVMHEGKIIECGPASEVLTSPKEEYTRRLISATRIDKHEAFEPGDVILDVRGLSHTFRLSRRERLTAVKNVSFELRKGEILGIVGESGSGKSTLLRCLLNLYEIQDGSVIYKGIHTEDKDEHRANRRLLQADRQIILQDSAAALNPRMMVQDIITEPLKLQGRMTPRGSYRKEAIFQLSYVGMSSEYAERYPKALSGGQRQRVAIARALTMDPGLLLCDEAVSSLDMQVQRQVIELLRHMRDEHGCSIIFVTHDLRAARMLCDRIAVMKAGEIVETGSSEDVFERPESEYTKKLISAMPGGSSNDQ